jgi:hypothetical protein
MLKKVIMALLKWLCITVIIGGIVWTITALYRFIKRGES